MEIRQLNIFLKAAETLNFAEAARLLFMTQSAFTQNIKQLEEELGVPLFDRNSHSVHLTEAGEVMQEYARKTINMADECKAHIMDLKQMKSGVLRIGVTHSFSLMTTEVIKDFCKLYPNVSIEITFKRMEELLLMLQHHELDGVLSYMPLKQPKQVDSDILFHDRLGVVMRRDNSLAKRKSLKLKDISKYSFALPARGLQARNVLERVFADSDEKLNMRVELNIATPLLRLVRDSKMLTILSCTSVCTFPELCAVPLDEDNCEMIGCLHTLKNTYCKHSMKQLVRLLKEYISFHGMK